MCHLVNRDMNGYKTAMRWERINLIVRIRPANYISYLGISPKQRQTGIILMHGKLDIVLPELKSLLCYLLASDLIQVISPPCEICILIVPTF